MALSREDVEKVALLARLALSDEELDAITPQLSQIVGYVDQLAEVDTNGVEPMAHALDSHNVLRPDETAESLTHADALANAPRKNGQGYLVPAVLGD